MTDIYRDPLPDIPRSSPLHRIYYGHLWKLGLTLVALLALLGTAIFSPPYWADWVAIPVVLFACLIYGGILIFLVHPWFVRMAQRQGY